MSGTYMPPSGLFIGSPASPTFPIFYVTSDGIVDVNGHPVTDRSADLQAAVDAAAATKGGGEVWILGPIRVREAITIEGSTFRSIFDPSQPSNPVVIRGVSDCDYGTYVYWDPIVDADDFLCFVPFGAMLPYVSGGVKNLEIITRDDSCTGVMIRQTFCYRTMLENVWISCGFNTGGCTAFLVEAGPNPGETSQHIRWHNLHAQGVAVGADIGGVQEMVAIELNLQAYSQHAIIRGGTIMWAGGLVQGGAVPLELRPVLQGDVFLHMNGVYFEDTGVPTATIKGYPPSSTGPGGYSGQLVVTNATDNATAFLMDLDGYGLQANNIKQSIATALIKAVRCSIIGIDCEGGPSNYDIDADTATRCTWINRGVMTVGTPYPTADGTNMGLVMAKPMGLVAVTQTERDALASMPDGALVMNETADTPQAYSVATGRWLSLRNKPIYELLSGLLLSEWDVRKAASASAWTDGMRAIDLIPRNGAALAIDAGFFDGHPVYQCRVAAAKCLNTNATLVFPAGATYYVSWVSRCLDIAGAGDLFLQFTDDPIVTNIISMDRPSATDVRVYQGGGIIQQPLYDTDVHVWELFSDGVQTTLIRDGVAYTGPATPLALDVERFAIGGSIDSLAGADENIARVRCCSAPPSAELREVLREMDYEAWAFNP